MDSSALNRFIFSIGRHCRCLLLLSLLFYRSIHPFTLSYAIWIGTNARIISNSHHFDLPKFRSVLMDYQKLIFFRTRTTMKLGNTRRAIFETIRTICEKEGASNWIQLKHLHCSYFQFQNWCAYLLFIEVLFWKSIKIERSYRRSKWWEFLIIWNICPNSKWRDTTASKGQSATTS